MSDKHRTVMSSATRVACPLSANSGHSYSRVTEEWKRRRRRPEVQGPGLANESLGDL
jgi:hypothetical protein